MAQEDVPPPCPRQRQPPSRHPQAAAPSWELGVQLHVLRAPARVSPARASGSSKDTSVPAVDPSVACEPAPAPLGRVPGAPGGHRFTPWAMDEGVVRGRRRGPWKVPAQVPETFLSHGDTGNILQRLNRPSSLDLEV